MDINIGLIGCGNIFPVHARSIKENNGLNLKAVCDIKKERAGKRAAEYACNAYLDYKKMLKEEKLDAVHVLTPNYLHAPVAIDCLKRKVHVLTEKPIAIYPKDVQKMIDAAKENQVKLGVIFQNRYNPGAQLVKKRLTEGKLGKIKAARVVLSYHKPDEYYSESDWKGTWGKEGGGVLMDQSIHFIDVIDWFFSDDVEYVEGHIAKRMHKKIEVEDMAEGVVKYKNGGYLLFYLTNFYSYDDDVEIELDCEKGRVNIIKDSARIGYFAGGEEWARPDPKDYIDYGSGVKDYWGVCHCIQIKQFYNALKENRQPQISGEKGLKTQIIVSAIYQSAKKRKRIHFN